MHRDVARLATFPIWECPSTLCKPPVHRLQRWVICHPFQRTDQFVFSCLLSCQPTHFKSCSPHSPFQISVRQSFAICRSPSLQKLHISPAQSFCSLIPPQAQRTTLRSSWFHHPTSPPAGFHATMPLAPSSRYHCLGICAARCRFIEAGISVSIPRIVVITQCYMIFVAHMETLLVLNILASYHAKQILSGCQENNHFNLRAKMYLKHVN